MTWWGEIRKDGKENEGNMEKLFQKISFYVCIYSDKDISQGSVATQLRRGGIFNNHVIANFPQSVTVKEF